MKKWWLLALLLAQIPLCYAFQPDIGIVGLKDFQFGQVTARDTNVVSTQIICVYSLDSGTYTLRVTGTTNSKGEFVVDNNGEQIPVSLSWGGLAIKPNASYSIHGAATHALVSCDNASAIELKLILHPLNDTVLHAGHYKLNFQFHLDTHSTS